MLVAARFCSALLLDGFADLAGAGTARPPAWQRARSPCRLPVLPSQASEACGLLACWRVVSLRGWVGAWVAWVEQALRRGKALALVCGGGGGGDEALLAAASKAVETHIICTSTQAPPLGMPARTQRTHTHTPWQAMRHAAPDAHLGGVPQLVCALDPNWPAARGVQRVWKEYKSASRIIQIVLNEATHGEGTRPGTPAANLCSAWCRSVLPSLGQVYSHRRGERACHVRVPASTACAVRLRLRLRLL